MFLPTIFFVAFALYICITITLVVALIYNSRKSKYPDLKAMKQGIDYFTQGVGVMASVVDFWLDPDTNKKVITTFSSKSRVFVCLGRQAGKFSDLAGNYKVYAPTADLKYLFKMMLFVYNSKAQITFVDSPLAADIKCQMMKKNAPMRGVISYKDVQINRVNFFLPFARFVNSGSDELFLVVDYLLYDTVPRVEPERESDLDSFYKLYLPFYGRGVEMFQEPGSELFIYIDKPIPDLQMLVNKHDDFRVMKFKVQLYPQIQAGDRLSITGQLSPSKNGLFFVERKDSNWIYVQSYKYVYNFYNDFVLTRKTDNGIVGKRKGAGKGHGLEKAWFLDLDLPGTISKDGIALIWKNKGDEGSYHCVPDNSYKTQEACESKVDMVGLPKPFHIWDKMCMKNTDCPFYDITKDRGGCDNGYCEMPVGVTRVGYTRYVKGENSFPYCHQCRGFDPACCSLQTAPDYAFSFERIFI